METIFDYEDYKAYLKAYLEQMPAKGHGFRSKMATALGCQVAYVSQVLNQRAHFSLEQAEELNGLLSHTEAESRFFLLLVQHARAGTRKLSAHFAKEISQAVEARQKLKNRVEIRESLGEPEQIRYYSSWKYAAAHMGVTVPALQTRESLARRLRIPATELETILEFLISVGLIKTEGRHLKNGVNRIFLANDSLMSQAHHSNWRLQALDSLGRAAPEDIHFSGVFTLAQNDMKTVREEILKGVDRARKIVKETAAEEEMICLNVDLFDV